MAGIEIGKIFFVRHGESEANVRGVFAGQKEDSILTEKGREQARKAAMDFKNKNILIDRVIVSPLLRARETAKIIIETMGNNLQMEIDQRIVEYDMGSLTGTSIRKVTSLELTMAEGAEDTEKFKDRVHGLLNELLMENKNVLVVSHAGVGRIIESRRKGLPSNSFYDLDPLPNAEIIELQLDQTISK